MHTRGINMQMICINAYHSTPLGILEHAYHANRTFQNASQISPYGTGREYTPFPAHHPNMHHSGLQ